MNTEPLQSSHLIIPPAELRRLIAGRQEFGSVEALCIDLCGGAVDAGRMMYRLFVWWQKSRHPQGWVYKSHVDWYTELRIKRSQLPPTKSALALAGVEMRLLKGNLSSPRVHYRLNTEAFIGALVKLLGLDAEWLKKFCAPFMQSTAEASKNRLHKRQAIDCPTPVQSSTGIPTDSSSPDKQKEQPTTEDARAQKADGGDDSIPGSGDEHLLTEGKDSKPAFEETTHERDDAQRPIPPVPPAPLPDYVQRLVAEKDLDPAAAADYVARFPVEECELAAEKALKARGSTSPAGLWRTWMDARRWANAAAAQPAHENDYVNHTSSAADDTPPTREELEAEWRRRHPTPKTTTVPDSAAVAQWRSAFAQLEIQLDQANFETWLRDAQFVDFEDGVPGTFVIGVRNNYARDMLTHRLYRSVQRVLCDVVGSDVELRFEVQERRRDEGAQDEMPLFKILANPRLSRLYAMSDEQLAEALNVPVVGA